MSGIAYGALVAGVGVAIALRAGRRALGAGVLFGYALLTLVGGGVCTMFANDWSPAAIPQLLSGAVGLIVGMLGIAVLALHRYKNT